MKKSVFNMGIPFKWIITQDRGIRVKTGNKQRKKTAIKHILFMNWYLFITLFMNRRDKFV